MKFNAITVVKKTVSFVVGAGTAKIVRDIISSNVEAETTYHAVTVTAASVAIGGAVSEATKKYTDAQIDDFVNFIKELKNRNKETIEEN